MDRYHFSTVVSKNHLFKLLAMYASLSLKCSNFRLYILCADDAVSKILNVIQLKNVTALDLKELESEALTKARADRVFHAFCWTLKPVFLHYVVQRYPDAEYFAHLDSDLCFYSDVSSVFNENPDAFIYLTHHRNSRRFMHFYPLTGIYNTGFVGLRPEEESIMALKRWKEQCLLDCPIKEDPVRRLFGDQRYVEDWPATYKNVHIVRSPGANTAIWNIENYKVSVKDENVHINKEPLIFYHFSGLSIINSSEFNLSWFFHIDDGNTVEFIYKPYLKLLHNAIKETGRYFPWFRDGLSKRSELPDVHHYVLYQ